MSRESQAEVSLLATSDLDDLVALLDPTDDPQMLGRLGGYEVCGLIGRGATRLVMKYIPGPSLQQRIDQGGPLDTTEVTRIGLQVALGLTAAHAQGIVHRDVKPPNVILESMVERAMVTASTAAQTSSASAVSCTPLARDAAAVGLFASSQLGESEPGNGVQSASIGRLASLQDGAVAPAATDATDALDSGWTRLEGLDGAPSVLQQEVVQSLPIEGIRRLHVRIEGVDLEVLPGAEGAATLSVLRRVSTDVVGLAENFAALYPLEFTFENSELSLISERRATEDTAEYLGFSAARGNIVSSLPFAQNSTTSSDGDEWKVCRLNEGVNKIRINTTTGIIVAQTTVSENAQIVEAAGDSARFVTSTTGDCRDFCAMRRTSRSSATASCWMSSSWSRFTFRAAATPINPRLCSRSSTTCWLRTGAIPSASMSQV